jgi:hypothetical protein
MDEEFLARELPPEVMKNLADPLWRIRNVYTIVDRNAEVIPFDLNVAQDDFLGKLHTRNIILKARQRGFSTLIQIAGLDQALWNDNYSVGIIADTLDNAAVFLKRIEFAYNHMPEEFRAASEMQVDRSNGSFIQFSNGSTIRVDTSYRSGTLQFLHVSEFGKICAKAPDKAREIVTGSFPALAPSGMGFVESTAEGNEGDFFDMVQRAQNLQLSNRKLNTLDWKFHFYSWYDEIEYQLDPRDVPMSQQDREYFEKVEREEHIVIDPTHRAWYVAQKETLGEDMKREHPTTPKEAFEVSIDGQYYVHQLAKARLDGRVGRYPHLADRPVYTFWDIGANDSTAIWFMQYVGARFRWVNYLEANGAEFNYFVLEMVKMGYVFGIHYLPHDAEQKRQLGMRLVDAETMLQELMPSWKFEVVERIADVTVGIKQTRTLIHVSEFDEEGCKLGLKRLGAYRKDWNERLGTWRETPRHDDASNGSDAIRQAGQLYAAGELNAPPPVRTKTLVNARNWRTA